MEIHIPLSYQEIVNEIVDFTDLPRHEVEERVWMQALGDGSVTQDAQHFGVTPHQYDEKMERLYREGYGLIFETLVFWASAERQLWIQQAVERIRLYAQKSDRPFGDIAILMLGDGCGNDSLELIRNGFKVNYFDIPGSKTYNFATKRFEHYGLLGNSVNILSDYDSCLTSQYDIVLSFEVLEHLTDPVSAIRDISSMLKNGGIAMITEAFEAVSDNFPTHLQSNLKFADQTPFLFLQSGMLLSWYSQKSFYKFKPMEFSKLEKLSVSDYLSLLRDPTVIKPYLNRKFSNFKLSVKRLIGFASP
ncbi:MAG: methyltransferase domain-containing protein [Stigonema ocellatum SAG 48.90 = DSM 106950]|nr:methyltransferase domain-containing protein [Stigonema ocellatum SAG 48.90 = DSM 106950]